jgi:hypothetical protein
MATARAEMETKSFRWFDGGKQDRASQKAQDQSLP